MSTKTTTQQNAEQLQEITGIGTVTAESLALSGYMNPEDLCVSYLTSEAEEIEELLYSEDLFMKHLKEDCDLTNSNIGVAEDPEDNYAVEVMTFIRQFGASHINLIDSISTPTDRLTVEPREVNWDAGFMAEPLNVYCLIYDEEKQQETLGLNIDEITEKPTKVDETLHRESITFYGSADETHLTTKYLEDISSFTGIDYTKRLDRLWLHPEHEVYPVRLHNPYGHDFYLTPRKYHE